MNSKFKFTEAKIKTLFIPANNQRILYFDTETRGLGIRVMPSGVKTYFLRRKFRGRSERITLGRSPELSLLKARKRAAEAHIQMDAGINPNEIKRVANAEVTLNDFFKIYMESHVRSHNKRPDDTEAEFRRYLLKSFGSKRLSEINKPKIAAFHAKLGRDIGKRTANKVHTLLRALFNRAIEWSYFDSENPTKGIKRFKEEKRERFLSGSELKRFFSALAQEPNSTMSDFFLILLFTGARSGEARSMKWHDIDLESRLWRLGRLDTKTDESRIITLPQPAIDILKNRKNEESEYVFSGSGKSGFLQEPKGAWSRMLSHAKIHNFRIHDLRHTWASWMVAQGVSLPVVQKALGHRNISSTAIYANTDFELISRESEKTAQAIIEKGTKE